MNVVIRTNLYARRLAQQRAKAHRNRAITALFLFVAAAVGAVCDAQRRVEVLRREYAVAKATASPLLADLQEARDRWAERAAHAARRDPVLTFAKRRWNWAPILERVFVATPPNIEISSLKISTGSAEDGTLQISGRSAGLQPRVQSDKYRLLLANTMAEAGCTAAARFLKLEDSSVTIRYEDTEYAAADFVIEVTLSDLSHEGRGT